MEKQKFNKSNKLAEEALMELRQRIAEISLIDAGVDVEIKEDVLKIFQVDGEPNWGEKFIIVTKKNVALLQVLTGDKDLCSLTKNEWSEILNPSPSNKLIYKYFKKLHNSFKTNAISSRTYTSAFVEINLILKEKWEASQTNHNLLK